MSGNHMLVYEPSPCPVCGATTEKEAETMCRPQSDETGERECPGADRIDADGKLMQPSAASIAAMDAWIDEQARKEGWK